jgi:hypothetical protein
MKGEDDLEMLTSMGFPEDKVRVALSRTNNLDLAVQMLSTGCKFIYNKKYYLSYTLTIIYLYFYLNKAVDEDDGEFDLIAAAPPEPEIKPPTVFNNNRIQASSKSNEEIPQEDSYEEFEDSRISSFLEMGFTKEQALHALAACQDDVNEALNMLLGTSSK